MLEKNLLEKWCLRVKRFQFAHRFAAKGFSRFHLILGISAIVLATTTGTTIFASLETELPEYGKILTGLLSLITALLSALQTFLRLDERSERHQRADASYSTVRQKIEQYQALPHDSPDRMQEFCDLIREEMHVLAGESPLVPERYWQKARAILAVPTHKSIANK